MYVVEYSEYGEDAVLLGVVESAELAVAMIDRLNEMAGVHRTWDGYMARRVRLVSSIGEVTPEFAAVPGCHPLAPDPLAPTDPNDWLCGT